jgi:hypothetical protein
VACRDQVRCAEPILDPMPRRLFACVIVLVIAGAPLASDACRAVCAMTASHRVPVDPTLHQANREGHSCHDGAAVDRPRLSQPPHGCGQGRDSHSTALDVVFVQRSSMTAPLALLAVSNVATAGYVPTLTFMATPPPQRTFPTAARSTIPLRI